MIWFLLVVLVVIAIAPFVLENRRPEMDDAARVDAPGSFAELGQGVTHYQWHGPEKGPVAVCVHGLTTPSFVWEQMIEQLTGLGYRVLTYDLFGRGFSDRPDGNQDDAFFLQQLEDLLRHEKIADDITLFGYSMGGVIASCYAARHPDDIRQLVLLAPAGFGGFPTKMKQAMRDFGRTGEWLSLTVMLRDLVKNSRQLAKLHPKLSDQAQQQAGQTKWRGFAPSVLSSLRHVLRDEREYEHRKLGRVDVPVLAIWAAKDQTIPLSGMSKLAKWNRDAVQVQIEGATHWMPMTHAKLTADAFRDARE